MMDMGDLIAREMVFPSFRAKSKKQALEDLALKAAEATGVAKQVIFEALLQRERLGSTGIGRGIAIPHCRLGSIKRIVGLCARLVTPIEFEAQDGEPVDVVFVLLAPEDAGADHLKALATVSRLMRQPALADKIRRTTDRAALYSILTEPAASHAA
jgi:PTS system nitrogen regulatory IIA component